jgi:DNA-binding MarR family transcriptional regulator
MVYAGVLVGGAGGDMSKGKNRLEADGLGGSVTHLLHRALQLALDLHAEAGPAEITQRQYTVLAAAAASDGQTQNDLVRATGIDRSTLADLVARMLAKGLLERQRSVTDARANTVRLSEAGRRALTASSGPAAAADERLLGYLPPKRRDAFLKSLAALAVAADGGVPAEIKPPKEKAAKDGKAKVAKVKSPPKAPKPDKKKKKKAKKPKEVAA